MARLTTARMIRHLAPFALLLIPVHALADTGIPGPLMLFGGAQTVSFLQWVAATMFMCIGVEWAVYRYSGGYRRPLAASALSNTVSLIAGFPLVFLGGIDPTQVLLPTVVSVLVEYWVIRGASGFVLADADAKFSAGPVIWGNVVSNVMLMGMLEVAFLKSEGRLSEFIFF